MTWAQGTLSVADPVRWGSCRFPPGGPAEILARLFGQFMSERLGQPFVIENRPRRRRQYRRRGGGTPRRLDGYTMLLVTTANAINASLYERLNYNFISRYCAGRRAHPRAPRCLRSIQWFPVDFPFPHSVAYARQKSGQTQYGVGRQWHHPARRGRDVQNDGPALSLQHVPYRGQAPALTDLIGRGRCQVHVRQHGRHRSSTSRAGKVRAARGHHDGAIRRYVLPQRPDRCADFSYPTFEASGPGTASLWPAKHAAS